jgi:outer membrane murein-binding lipoprotein Lpp
MTNQNTERTSSMTRWLVIGVMAVLVIAIVVISILLSQKVNSLNRDLDNTNSQVATLQSKVNSLTADLTSTQGKLMTAESESTSLKTELTAAQTQIGTLNQSVASKQTTIDQQTDQITTMRYPKHFATAEELANWLQKDNTDTLYPNPTLAQKMLLAFTLQIHAARDGFIICTNLPTGGQLDLVTNRAVVGDVIYEIRPWDDFAQKWNSIPVMPSYPITPESGQ